MSVFLSFLFFFSLLFPHHSSCMVSFFDTIAGIQLWPLLASHHWTDVCFSMAWPSFRFGVLIIAMWQF